MPLALAACLALAGCDTDHRTPLTVYSPHGKELLTDYAARFERAHPDVRVEWVDMGSQEVLDRLRAERDNPQADVWFGSPGDLFEHGAKEGLLQPYRPTWADRVDPDARGDRDLWYGTYITPEIIGYNAQAIPAADAPRDWDDLLLPRWKDEVIVRDPVASGSMRAIFGAILERSIRETGSTRAGWEWLRRLDGNTREYTLNATLMYQMIGRRDGLVTLYNMPDLASLRQRYHIPVDYVFPRSGTPLLVDGIAVVKGAAHPALAQQFYEFVTTPEMLLVAAREHTRIPARQDIPADALPDWIRQARAQLTQMPLDRKMLADSLDGWMQYWDSNIRNSARDR